MNMKRLVGICCIMIVTSLATWAQEKVVVPERPQLVAEVFPACYQGNRYNLVANFPGVLVFTFKGDPEKVREAWISMDLPPGVKLIGASTFRPTKHRIISKKENETYNWEADSVIDYGSIKHMDKDYSRSVITVNASLIRRLSPENVEWGCHERVYIQASPALIGKSCKIYWRVLTRDGEGPQQSIDLSILPPLEPSPKAKRFQLMVCYLAQASAPYPAVREAYYSYWLSLSQRPYTFVPFYDAGALSDELRDRMTRDFRCLAMVSCNGTGPQLNHPVSERFPKLVNPDAKTAHQKTGICPSYLVEDPGGCIWEQAVPERLDKRRPSNAPWIEAIVFDFEPEGICFCETCRKQFAAFAKLATVPDVKEIKAKYSAAWFDFRVQLNMKINRKLAEVVRKRFPYTKYWICTDALHSNASNMVQWISCDERTFDPDVDVHLPMIYRSGLSFYKDVELNVRTLKKPVFPLIDPAERMMEFYSRYSPLKVKQSILACAVHGAMGIGFWPQDYLDGAYLESIAQGMGLVARMEDYYFAKRDDSLAEVKPEPIMERTVEDGGKQSKLTSPSFGENIQYTVHQKNRNRLITIFNFDEKTDAILRIKVPKLPPGEYRVRDVESGRVYLDADKKPLGAEAIANGFLSKVKANHVLLLEVAQDQVKDNGIPQREFQKEIEAMRAKFGNASAFNGASQGEAVAGWGDFDGNGVSDIKLSLAGNWAYVDFDSTASIVGWRSKNTGRDVLVHGKDRGVLGQLVIDEKQGALLTQWELKALEIRDCSPVAVLSARLVTDLVAAGANPEGGSPLDGLEIEKTIGLDDKGASLKIAMRFTNSGPRKVPMTFSFRVKNVIARDKPAVATSRIRLKSPDGEKEIKGDESHRMFIIPGGDNHPFLDIVKDVKPEQWYPAALNIEEIEGKTVRQMVIEPDPRQTAGFYSWWGTNIFTFELLSREITLAPGESVTYEQICRLVSL
ncbi:MAG: hypothetical protein A2020_09470 [Lentisphaerae bacterium GWF2_45_14]|nr:MAG: hypothetical protein A2020_09470 [Lentisphaerae bacterium GWF2_45_14]